MYITILNNLNILNILSIILAIFIGSITGIVFQYFIDIFSYVKFCRKYYNLNVSYIKALKISSVYNKHYIQTYGIVKFLLYL